MCAWLRCVVRPQIFLDAMRCVLLAILAVNVQCFVPGAAVRPSAVVARASPAEMKAKDGIFTPIVKLVRGIVGDKAFLPFRAKVISKHTEIIQSFVETSDSPFGCMALEKLFEVADMDGNGTIDRDELKVALNKLGFSHLTDAQIDKILERADADDNCVIDYDEFVKEAPKTLKTNLVKLAKNNGADLGFLS